MRLDLNNYYTRKVLDDVYGLPQNSDQIVDICLDCYRAFGFTDDVAHPPYEEMIYECFICGQELIIKSAQYKAE